jgi:hypothetical protein
MKNILAENMLRFGPKNLSESDKIRLQRLTESVDITLAKHPDYPKAYETFYKLLQKGTYTGKYIGTQTIWYINQNPSFSEESFISIFKPMVATLGGKSSMLQFPIPTPGIPSGNLILTTAQSQQSSDIKMAPKYFRNGTNVNSDIINFYDAGNFQNVSIGTGTPKDDVDYFFEDFGKSGGTSADFLAFIQKNPTNFNLAAIKGQSNYASVTATFTNSIAKEVVAGL